MSTLTSGLLSARAGSDAHAIRAPGEVTALLRDLVRDAALLTARFHLPDGKDCTRMVSVVGVDEWVHLEPEGERSSLRHLAESALIQFHGRHGRIPIAFAARSLRTVTSRLGGLAVPLPELVVRTQRRQFHRVATPWLHQPPCCFSLADGTRLKGRVADMGLGGIGLRVDGDTPALAVGERLHQAHIALPEGSVAVELEIRHQVAPLRVGGSLLLGCRFVAPANAACATLQRYIHRIDRERLRQRRR